LFLEAAIVPKANANKSKRTKIVRAAPTDRTGLDRLKGVQVITCITYIGLFCQDFRSFYIQPTISFFEDANSSAMRPCVSKRACLL
jgi:hypothetical protein